MSPSILISSDFLQITKIEPKFDFLEKSGGLVLWICNCILKPRFQKYHSVERYFSRGYEKTIFDEKMQGTRCDNLLNRA